MWLAAAIAGGVLYLFLKLRKTRARAALSLLGMGGLWCALVLLYNLNVFAHLGIRVFNMPEINTFCLLGVFEICIRNRLFPYNENYTGFFSRLSVPVLITDRKFDPAYHTAVPVTADKAFLEASLAGPVYPREDLRLSGMPIQAGAGCAFWEEDEQALHRQRRRLASANELLGAENELIEAGNRMKEQKARLDAQNLVYDRIAEALYPKQKQIEALLSDVKPETELEKSLFTVDELTGIVQAASLMRPTGISDLEVKSLKKKYKDKKFAAKCSREVIDSGCEMLGMENTAVMEIVIRGMQQHMEALGIGPKAE